LATATKNGLVAIWDLEEKTLVSTINFQNKINLLHFLENELTLLIGSGEKNAIISYIYKEDSKDKFD